MNCPRTNCIHYKVCCRAEDYSDRFGECNFFEERKPQTEEYFRGYLQGCKDTAKKVSELQKIQLHIPYGRGDEE